MKTLYRKSILALLVAAAVVTTGCSSDQVDAIQPLVDTFNEGLTQDVVETEQPDVMLDQSEVETEQPDVMLDQPTGTTELLPTGIITEVAIGGIQGVFLPGLPPESTGSISLNPLVIDDQPVQFISGGSTQVPLQSDVPFITVFVAADTEGYFQIDLQEAITAADLIVTFSTIQLDGDDGDIDVQVGSSFGDISGAQELPVTSVVVGTGDLQVSVSWNTRADVDLYLLEPTGETIFFGNGTSEAGGMLDLDSNVGCPENQPQNENITYENAVPPTGEYIVFLDLFSTCGIVNTPTEYVVTVRSSGDVQTFTGSLLPDANPSDVTITSFEVR